MLTLATNLLLWVLAVTNDSMHREIEAELNALTEEFSGTRRRLHPFPQTHTRVYIHTTTHIHICGHTGAHTRGHAETHNHKNMHMCVYTETHTYTRPWNR